MTPYEDAQARYWAALPWWMKAIRVFIWVGLAINMVAVIGIGIFLSTLPW